jgi:hypothetical protein
VPVTVNQLNGVNSDGENGRFIDGLGKREANYFQIATPTGKLVDGLHLNGVNVDNKAVVEASWKKWRQMPEADRKPPHLYVDKTPSSNGPPQPPPGGLVVRVYTRNMKGDPQKGFARISKQDLRDKATYADPSWSWANGIYTEPMPDVMWLTEADWKSLIPPSPKKGNRFSLPEPLQKRILRYHLIDGTYGLPFAWKLQDVRTAELTLTVEETSPKLRMVLQGSSLLSTAADLTKASHGFEAQLRGVLEFDPVKQTFSRFDMVAIGDCWGGDWEGGRFARPGRAPLGVAFELATGKTASDRIPPKGQGFNKTFADHYFAAERD